MRFRQAGWQILFVPKIEVLHYKGACSKDHPIRVLFYMHRGMIHFYGKFFRQRYPLPLMLIVMGTVWARFFLLIARELVTTPIRKQSAAVTAPAPLPFKERRKFPPVVAYIGHERRTNGQTRLLPKAHSAEWSERTDTSNQKCPAE